MGVGHGTARSGKRLFEAVRTTKATVGGEKSSTRLGGHVEGGIYAYQALGKACSAAGDV